MEKIERVNLRLNLENPIDREIWDFIKDEKRKGTFIKKTLYNAALGKLTQKDISKSNIEIKNDVTEDEVEEITGF